jgi:glyoxylase-like metal-dependent hydrolase (beta-lactamase superfamily II)
MLQRDAAPGIHRVEDAYTNWYIVEDGGALTIVDAGLPASWRSLQSALAELGRPASDIRAIVLEHERTPLKYVVRYPAGLKILLAMGLAGAPLVKGVGEVRAFAEEEVLDVPGRPHPVFTPGHTHGHVALHFPERGTLIAGDALVTLDPYTACRGPRVVARAANADSGQAIASLQRLADTRAEIVLTGHGEPWTGGVQEAVDRAREAGTR